MRRFYVLVLVVIVAIGAALRLFDLSSVPTGNYAEELDLYNSVSSIVTTGRDIDGQLLPYFYQAHVRRNAPIYPLAAYASTRIFGKNAFALRLPAALFGTAAIVFMFLLVFALTRRRDVAIIAALAQATSPIFVHFSRISWSVGSIVVFLLAGLWLLVAGLRSDRFSPWKVLLAGGVLGLTSYTYAAGVVYAPLLAAAVIGLQARRFTIGQWRWIEVAAAIWIVLSLPAFWVLSNDGTTASSITSISTFGNGVNFNSLHTFFQNYTAHFWWDYLVRTGAPMPHHISLYLTGFGAFYWWIVVLAVIGAALGFRVAGRWPYGVALLWLIAYPLGGALTDEGVFTNAPRTLAGAPAFCLLAALGFGVLYDSVKARPWRVEALGLLAIVSAISVGTFAHFYFTEEVHQFPQGWNSGSQQAYELALKYSAGKKRLCDSGYWVNKPTYFLFYFSGVPVDLIQNVTDPACSLPGTLRIERDDDTAPPTFTRLAEILDVDGNKVAAVWMRR